MSMVERVARALAEYQRGDSDAANSFDREAARLVIEAMREPTDAMIKASEKTQLHSVAYCEGMYRPEDAVEFYSAMIDAAPNGSGADA